MAMTPAEFEARVREETPTIQVVFRWRVWKRTHDRADAKHCCCEHTLALFEALDELERGVTDDFGADRRELAQ